MQRETSPNTGYFPVMYFSAIRLNTKDSHKIQAGNREIHRHTEYLGIPYQTSKIERFAKLAHG